MSNEELIKQLKIYNELGVSLDKVIDVMKKVSNEDEEVMKKVERKQERRNKFCLYKRKESPFYVAEYKIQLDNKTVSIKKSTGTPNEEEAMKWASENMDRVIEEYKKRNYSLEDLLSNFYKPNSKYLLEDNLHKPLTDTQRKKYDYYMNTHVLPFWLNERKLKTPADITINEINKLRNHLLSTLSKSTVGDITSAIRKFVNAMANEGITKLILREKDLERITNHKEIEKRGSFKEAEIKGFFNNEWDESDEYFYMLCLIGFFSGMRNSEVYRIQPEDFIKRDDIVFLKVRGTKTENAIREIPIHSFCYEKIKSYQNKHDIHDGDFLFRYPLRMDKQFTRATDMMARKLGYSEEQQKKENITYYGFRHLYKTMLVSGGLNDTLSELFMGHSLDSGVSKTYVNIKAMDLVQAGKQVIDIFNNKI